MGFISALHSGKFVTLPEQDFLSKYDTFNSYISYGETKEEAEKKYIQEWFGLTVRDVNGYFVGHCHKCGEPVVSGSYVRFMPTQYGLNVPKRHWYLHGVCYQDLTGSSLKDAKLNRFQVEYLKKNKPVFTMHTVPNMRYVCYRKGIRIYTNLKETLYVKRDTVKDKTYYQIARDLSFTDIETLFGLINHIERSEVVL